MSNFEQNVSSGAPPAPVSSRRLPLGEPLTPPPEPTDKTERKPPIASSGIARNEAPAVHASLRGERSSEVGGDKVSFATPQAPRPRDDDKNTPRLPSGGKSTTGGDPPHLKTPVTNEPSEQWASQTIRAISSDEMIVPPTAPDSQYSALSTPGLDIPGSYPRSGTGGQSPDADLAYVSQVARGTMEVVGEDAMWALDKAKEYAGAAGERIAPYLPEKVASYMPRPSTTGDGSKTSPEREVLSDTRRTGGDHVGLQNPADIMEAPFRTITAENLPAAIPSSPVEPETRPPFGGIATQNEAQLLDAIRSASPESTDASTRTLPGSKAPSASSRHIHPDVEHDDYQRPLGDPAPLSTSENELGVARDSGAPPKKDLKASVVSKDAKEGIETLREHHAVGARAPVAAGAAGVFAYSAGRHGHSEDDVKKRESDESRRTRSGSRGDEQQHRGARSRSLNSGREKDAAVEARKARTAEDIQSALTSGVEERESSASDDKTTTRTSSQPHPGLYTIPSGEPAQPTSHPAPVAAKPRHMTQVESDRGTVGHSPMLAQGETSSSGPTFFQQRTGEERSTGTAGIPGHAVAAPDKSTGGSAVRGTQEDLDEEARGVDPRSSRDITEEGSTHGRRRESVASSTASGGRTKVGLMQKLKGEAKVLAGKMGKDEDKVEEGKRLMGKAPGLN